MMTQSRWFRSDGFFSPWRPLALLGLNLIVLAMLIFAFPALLAYLIAAFLLLNGAVLLGISYHLRQAERRMTDEYPVSWHSI